jgi:hypothetical protein
MATWQPLGLQEMVFPGTGGIFGGGFTLRTYLWRSAVPGGWIVVFADETGVAGAVKASFFYPDPNHEWKGDDSMADTLLRASAKNE